MKSRFQFTILCTIFLALLTLFSALPVNAQTPTSLDGVDIYLSPVNPAPGQQITATLESFSTDLNAASIVWIVDGKNFTKGIGMKSIQLTAPTLGKTMTINAVIMTVEGREVKKILTTRSGGVDIIWESQGYTPPFYQGKSLFAYQNTVKVYAIPHLSQTAGVEIDPRTLVYKWKENDKVIQDQSGYGKQTLTLQQDIPRSLIIEVEVSTANGSQKAVGTINLTPTDPAISFYVDNPLYGVLFNKSISARLNLTEPEVTLRAVPYSFNINSSQSNLTYDWSINNFTQPDLAKNQSVTLRTQENAEGNSEVKLDIRNDADILQGANASLNIFFSKKTTTSETTFQ